MCVSRMHYLFLLFCVSNNWNNVCVVCQEGNTFCTTLEPRLFTIDVSIVEHNVFFTEVSQTGCVK